MFGRNEAAASPEPRELGEIGGVDAKCWFVKVGFGYFDEARSFGSETRREVTLDSVLLSYRTQHLS